MDDKSLILECDVVQDYQDVAEVLRIKREDEDNKASIDTTDSHDQASMDTTDSPNKASINTTDSFDSTIGLSTYTTTTHTPSSTTHTLPSYAPIQIEPQSGSEAQDGNHEEPQGTESYSLVITSEDGSQHEVQIEITRETNDIVQVSPDRDDKEKHIQLDQVSNTLTESKEDIQLEMVKLECDCGEIMLEGTNNPSEEGSVHEVQKEIAKETNNTIQIDQDQNNVKERRIQVDSVRNAASKEDIQTTSEDNTTGIQLEMVKLECDCGETMFEGTHHPPVIPAVQYPDVDMKECAVAAGPEVDIDPKPIEKDRQQKAVDAVSPPCTDTGNKSGLEKRSDNKVHPEIPLETQKEKPHGCVICGKRFSRSGDLKRHQRVHTRKKQYVCEVCNKHCRYEANFKKHLALYCGPKAYTCDICAKVFSRNYLLTNHKARHADEKSFKCQVCAKSFKQTRDMAQHMFTHSKPYKCNFCGKQFSKKLSFQVHLYQHTGGTIQMCLV